MSQASEQAVEDFKNGFNCAQAVLGALCERYDLEKEQAFRITSGLGGGMRCGEACGAVVGGVLLLGLRYGFSDAGEGNKKEVCYQKTVEFTENFKRKNGSIVCRELLGFDVAVPDEYAQAKELGLFQKICPVMIAEAVDILEKMG